MSKLYISKKRHIYNLDLQSELNKAYLLKKILIVALLKKIGAEVILN